MAAVLRKKPQRQKAAVKPPRSKLFTAGIAAAILLVVALALFAVMKYTGRSMITGAPSVPAAAPAPSVNGADGTGVSIPAVADPVISPPGASSRTPLSVAYEARNAGGVPASATFRWFVDGNLVQDGTSNALQPGPYRKGASVYVEVVLADQNGGNAIRTPVVVIVNGPPEIATASIGPENAVAGSVVSAQTSVADPDGDPLTCTHQWMVNGRPAEGAGTESTFSTSGLRKNDLISAAVTCSDGAAAGGPVVSNSIRLQNRSPRITSTAPSDLTTGLYEYQVSAEDPDGDRLTYRLDRFPAGMTVDAASGLVRWALPKGQMFTGRNEVTATVTVDDGDGGRESQDITIVFTDLYVN